MKISNVWQTRGIDGFAVRLRGGGLRLWCEYVDWRNEIHFYPPRAAIVDRAGLLVGVGEPTYRFQVINADPLSRQFGFAVVFGLPVFAHQNTDYHAHR